MVALSHFGSPASELHARFLAILPRIQRHAQIYHRDVKCPHKRSDRIAETVALSWRWFVNLAQRGKDATRWPSVLASYAAKAVRSGRRLCGTLKTRDVMSELAQQRHGFAVEHLPCSVSTSHDALYGKPYGQQHQDEWEQRLVDNTVTPVDEQVQFRLDFKAWLKSLTGRERRIIKAMLRNERTKDLAREFELSEGRISQLRREFLIGWKCFVGDEPIGCRRRLRQRKQRVRVRS